MGSCGEDDIATAGYDYEPWGGIMPGRNYASGSNTKEKFTGKERDAEIKRSADSRSVAK